MRSRLSGRRRVVCSLANGPARAVPIPFHKVSEQMIPARLLAWVARLRRSDAGGRPREEEPPLRSELFSAEQMERHGKELAAAHRLSTRRTPDRLLARLAENERVLAQACDRLTIAVTEGRRITPAAEW